MSNTVNQRVSIFVCKLYEGMHVFIFKQLALLLQTNLLKQSST